MIGRMQVPEMNTSGKRTNCTSCSARPPRLLMRLATRPNFPGAPRTRRAPMTSVTMMAAQWPGIGTPCQRAQPHDPRRVDEADFITQCATSPANITQPGGGVPRSRLSMPSSRRSLTASTASCESPGAHHRHRHDRWRSESCSPVTGLPPIGGERSAFPEHAGQESRRRPRGKAKRKEAALRIPPEASAARHRTCVPAPGPRSCERAGAPASRCLAAHPRLPILRRGAGASSGAAAASWRGRQAQVDVLQARPVHGEPSAASYRGPEPTRSAGAAARSARRPRRPASRSRRQRPGPEAPPRNARPGGRS